jgi:uncharacterized protein
MSFRDDKERAALESKLQALKDRLSGLGSVAVAFSGGVDSTLLLKVARDVLGDNVIAVTASSPVSPGWELEEASRFAEELGVRHIVIESGELGMEEFIRNDKNRCYYCKKVRFKGVLDVAKKYGILHVADGSNYDDLGDFRPGMKAAEELGVISPLMDVKMTKPEIRQLSKIYGLPTWDKPAYACLASRISYGQPIDAHKLRMIEKAEELLLHKLGFRQVRVRYHGDIARIEVGSDERNKFFDTGIMDLVDRELKNIGFTYVALDLSGYRPGSLNESLKLKGEI